MELDFDVLEFCRKLRSTKQPPYNCPVTDCGKTYKSMCGLQYHLVNYDHSDKPSTSGLTSKPDKDKSNPHLTAKKKTCKSPNTKKTKVNEYSAKDETKLEIEIDDKTYYIGIDEPLPVISKQNYELLYPSNSVGFSGKDSASKKEPQPSKFPEPSFSIIKDYSISKAPPRPLGYIRHIERNNEDLDAEVEYDIDEEDSAWLEIINKDRKAQNLDPVSIDAFELLMDRLEKEAFLQMSTRKEVPVLIDDDAICCICMDGECQNSNVILFCDLCNLAVHQDCYGVPYIPEGQWLCRRCMQSPSRAVDCVLCPNNGGAFKQTDRGHWAHVVCALWIPEVRFANTISLEPIDSIEAIPAARWKLTCYICKQRGVGACIQCYKSSCYAAFHVTCAQMSGLFMKMDAIKDNNSDKGEDAPVIVQKIAYCSTHTPPDAEVRPKVNFPSQPSQSNSSSAPPIISLPTIPPDRIQEIRSMVSMSKKKEFVQRLIAYWTLKRQLRNGVPLLRRLQATQLSKRSDSSEARSQSSDVNEMKKQLKYWQCLRQDLERARLLCELVRKREKLKKELVKVKEQCLELQLCPLIGFLRKLVDLLRSRDTGEIFIEPVDLVEVPDYGDIVKKPMDLSTMRHKVDSFQYNSLKEFEDDFNLMINNCLAYNSKDTVFYRAALKMREQGGAILKQAQKDLDQLGLSDNSGPSCSTAEVTATTSQDEITPADIDLQIENLLDQNSNLKPEERINRLQLLLEDCSKLKNAISRCRKTKHINKLISSIRRKKTNEHHGKYKDKKRSKKCLSDTSGTLPTSPNQCSHDSLPDSSTDFPTSETGCSTPLKDCAKSTSVVSPSGVNRRTAVLFTRKAAAALKSTPSSPQSPAEDSSSSQTTSHRKRGRQKYNLPFKFTNNSANSDSFNTYRTEDAKTDESNSDGESSCSGCSSSNFQGGSTSRSSSDWSDSEIEMNKDSSPMEALDQLQLVWAKCRGYPWYPALIINPKMPPGYMHNGVPIPIPPNDVIALASNYTEPVYLVLFFDTKRTWQWLPRNKLEPLGITYELDFLKLTESRKPADRKAVKKAYHEAMKYRTQIDKTPELISSALKHEPSN